MLKIRYEGTRIDCTTLETEYGADILEKSEFNMLISTLDKLVEHESWESIGRDDGLEYKKYTPSPKNNWFRDGKYKGKTIMKFRYSKVMRCFGYRKGDKLRLLRLERDHSISDNVVIITNLQGSILISCWNRICCLRILVLQLINMDFDGLRIAIIQMLSGTAVAVNMNTFQNDMVSFKNKDHIITLSIHLAYLAYNWKKRAA